MGKVGKLRKLLGNGREGRKIQMIGISDYDRYVSRGEKLEMRMDLRKSSSRLSRVIDLFMGDW